VNTYSNCNAARFLGISPVCLRKAAVRGWLPSAWADTRYGTRERVFTEADLIAYRDRQIVKRAARAALASKMGENVA
jgi:hypothetical protein